jgi:hypothetical protein
MKKILILLLILFFSCKNRIEREYELDFDVQFFLKESILHHETGFRDTAFIPTEKDSMTYFSISNCGKKELMNPNLVEDAMANYHYNYYLDYGMYPNDSLGCDERLGKNITIADTKFFSLKKRDSIINERNYKINVKVKGEDTVIDVTVLNYKVHFIKGDSLFNRVQCYRVQKKDFINLSAYFFHTN